MRDCLATSDVGGRRQREEVGKDTSSTTDGRREIGLLYETRGFSRERKSCVPLEQTKLAEAVRAVLVRVEVTASGPETQAARALR